MLWFNVCVRYNPHCFNGGWFHGNIIKWIELFNFIFDMCTQQLPNETQLAEKNCLHFHVFIQVIDVECCYIFTMEMKMGNSTMQPPCFRALNKGGYRTTDLILLCYQNCEGFLWNITTTIWFREGLTSTHCMFSFVTFCTSKHRSHSGFAPNDTWESSKFKMPLSLILTVECVCVWHCFLLCLNLQHHNHVKTDKDLISL